MRLKHREYQLSAARWMYDRWYGALFGDLGTGKTIIVLLVLEALRRDGAGKCLLIAPKNVKDHTWTSESKKFDEFHNLILSTGFAPGAHVHLVNPESLHKVPDWTIYHTLVIDESVDFKSSNSVRLQKLAERLPYFARRYILTAGPIPNSYEDLWAQCYVLDMGRRLGHNITTFRNKYCQRSQSGFGFDVCEWAEPEIDAAIADMSYRVDRTQHLRLPELVEHIVTVPLAPDVLSVYQRLEQELFAELRTERIVALSAAECYAKCRQFTGGFLYSWPDDIPKSERKECHRRTHWFHQEKLHALGRIHREIGYRPMLVVYEHDAEGTAIQNRFRCPRIHGKMTSGRQEILDRWNTGKMPMLCAQTRTVSRGLNLQFGGRDLLVYSVPPRADDYFQVLGRLHRDGATQTVHVWKLICQGTIDEVKLEPRLDSKLSKQRQMLLSIKKHLQSKHLKSFYGQLP